MTLYFIYQATGTRLGAVTQIIASLMTGIIIAFIHGWLTTFVILSVVPVIVVVNIIQSKLVFGITGDTKKAYEKAGSVSILVAIWSMSIHTSVLNIRTDFTQI